MPPRKRAAKTPAKTARPTAAERRAAKAKVDAEAAAAEAAARLDRARRVLALRRSGLDFAVITQQVKAGDAPIDRDELLALYELAIDETLPLSIDGTRRLELDRLERLITPLWTKAMSGDLEAAREIGRLSKLRVQVATSRSGLVGDEGRNLGPVETATKIEIASLHVGANSLAATAMLLARAVDEADLGTQAHANLGRELRMQMAQLRAAAGDGGVGAPEDASATSTAGAETVVPESRLAGLRARGAGKGGRAR